METDEWFVPGSNMEIFDWFLILLSFLMLGTAAVLWLAYQKLRVIQPARENAAWLKYSAILNLVVAPLLLLGVVFNMAIRAGVFLAK